MSESEPQGSIVRTVAQVIWFGGHYDRCMLDGKEVRVEFPGFWDVEMEEAGRAEFRGVKLTDVNTEEVREMDVAVYANASDVPEDLDDVGAVALLEVATQWRRGYPCILMEISKDLEEMVAFVAS